MNVKALSVPAALSLRARLRPDASILSVLPLALGLIAALPIVWLLVDSFNVAAPGHAAVYGLRNWNVAFHDRATWQALWNSISLGLVRTLIALPVALLLSWLVARTDMPGRGLIEMLCWLSIFAPVLPMTYGWILLLDPQFGLVNTELQHLPFVHDSIFSIYGFWGITWVHLASTSIAYPVVLLIPAFRRSGLALEEAARMCGAGLGATLRYITIPLLAPAILLVSLLSFVIGLQVFEVELVLGQPVGLWVYSTRIYDLARDIPPHYGEATALGFVFLIILLACAVMYQRYLHGRSFVTVTGRGYTTTPLPLRRWRWPAFAVCCTFFAVTLVAPLTLLIVGSFMRRYGFFQIRHPFTTAHWVDLFADPVFFSSIRNSLILAVATAILVVILYSLAAYALVRTRTRTSPAADGLMWLPWAVPGILMSLGFLWLFLSTPLRAVLYGTLPGIVIAFVIRQSPLSVQFFKASFLQIGSELEESARVHGASWMQTYRSVLLPLLAPVAVTVGLLAFLSSIRDISTPVLLYNPQSRPLAILLLEYTFSNERERGAAIGVLLAGFVLMVTLVARGIGLRLARETD
jgi:iron(III) transport system permease protein